ncbi:hypothetical protein B0O99DRAFT_683504 [Bisporella sp. PMI_857]|nr:hypothetical protein B0O99DRAFT_683504 [Bisporella sp. PMI_857]
MQVKTYRTNRAPLFVLPIASLITIYTLLSSYAPLLAIEKTTLLSHLPKLSTAASDSGDYHLQKLCGQTLWREGLWIQCHGNARADHEGKKAVAGGMNNVRNRIQSCLRLAIDAGAGVIIPMIATRDQTKLKHLGGGEVVPASRYWNMEHMEDVLQKQCPQLKVRYDMKGIEKQFAAPKRHYKGLRYQAGSFSNMTEYILKTEQVNIASIGKDNQVAITMGDSFLSWDYEKSDELVAIRKALFKTMSYNQTLLDISSKILQSPQLHGGFVGIHLRASNDWPNSFGNPAQQMRLYSQELEGLERNSPTDLRTLYVSCGNKTAIEIFKEKLEPLGYWVFDKWSLLADDPDMLKTVEALWFDEKAAVEYQMLYNANIFLGVSMSSMSSLIAYARSLDQADNFFPVYIYPESVKDIGEDGLGIRRTYPVTPVMKGDKKSRLMVVNGDDIMSYFP